MWKCLIPTHSPDTRRLRDHYRLEHNQTLIPTPIDSIRFIVQQTVKMLIHIIMYKIYRITRSILFIYGVNHPKNSEIVFEYDDKEINIEDESAFSTRSIYFIFF